MYAKKWVQLMFTISRTAIDYAHPIGARLLLGAGKQNHDWRNRHQPAQQEMVAQTMRRSDARGCHLLREHRAQHCRG